MRTLPFTAKRNVILPLAFVVTITVLTLTLLRRHTTAPSPLNHREAFLSLSDNGTISDFLRRLTVDPHLAPASTSILISHLLSLSLPTHTTTFQTLLTYHEHSSVTLDNDTAPLPLNDAVSPSLAPYHAYSPDADVYGPAVFLNHAKEKDFLTLRSLNVSGEGCVGIIRRGGGLTRYEAVQNAADNGLAAVLMYTESEEVEFRGGVERGTVMNGVGDPLTPGWAAVEGGERLKADDSKRFPAIASLPVSERVAETVLMGLKGAAAPEEWSRTSRILNRVKRVGPGPSMLNFSYKGESKQETINNVFAVIEGSEEPDRYVLLGNHRDAWTYGAVDPTSGTAALFDIARRLSVLLKRGWKPRRTIILCSWDAEEFGMIGSTEWVEQNSLNLRSKAVAYFNVDCAVQGPGLFLSATPQLDNLLLEAMKKVRDPDVRNRNLYEQWVDSAKDIQRLSRVDSDFVPFLHHAGIPSIDLYFGRDFPVYHTAFDTYDWMKKNGDPLFHRHVAAADIWGLVALRLADDPILPFNYTSYAYELQKYTDILKNVLEGKYSLHPITAAVQDFAVAAKVTEEEAQKLRHDESAIIRRRMLNDRLILAERGFLDTDGLHGKQWFKHLIYGPIWDTEGGNSFFPGIFNAISDRRTNGEDESLRHEIWRVARAIQRAASALRGHI